jgi:predicted Zn-dependent protease
LAPLEIRKAAIRGLLEQQDFAVALEQARALNQECPDDVAGYQLLSAAHLEIGNYAEAENAAQWMMDLRIGKTDAPGWWLIARLREAAGDLEGAGEATRLAFERLDSGQESEARALRTYAARLQYLAGRPGDAARIIQAGLETFPDDAPARELLAEVRIAQGRREEGVAMLRALSAEGAHPKVLYRLARITGERADFLRFERAARERSEFPASMRDGGGLALLS